MVVLTKASSDYWYRIRTINEIDRLYDEIGSFVVTYNHFFQKEKSIKEFWEGVKEEDIPLIAQCKLNIIIYDDYLE